MERDEQKRVFAIRLNQALRTSGMKAVELAKKTDTSPANVSRYRSAYAIPGRGKIVAMAKALNVSPMWLLGYSDRTDYDLSPKEMIRNKIDAKMEEMDMEKLNKLLNFINDYL